MISSSSKFCILAILINFPCKMYRPKQKKVPHNFWNQATPPPFLKKTNHKQNKKVPQTFRFGQDPATLPLEKFQTKANFFPRMASLRHAVLIHTVVLHRNSVSQTGWL